MASWTLAFGVRAELDGYRLRDSLGSAAPETPAEVPELSFASNKGLSVSALRPPNSGKVNYQLMPESTALGRSWLRLLSIFLLFIRLWRIGIY